MPKVFIGVGHGGADVGAVSGSLIERDINLIMATACATTLQQAGVTVKLSRTTNREADKVAQEVAECKAFSPHVAIEIHNNAGGGDGFECYTNGKADSIRLAEAIEKEVKAIGQNSRGVKYNAGFAWTKQTGYPVVLCEGFFLDNAKDRAKFDTTAEQQALGVAYANAILKYLGIPRPSAGQIVLLVNDNTVKVSHKLINGQNYIKLRDLVNVFPCEVGYDAARRMPYVKYR